MKQFTKRAALVFGLFCTALLCLGVVYIDNTKHFWRTVGDYTELWVNTNFVMAVNTNTGRIGINVSNANTISIDMQGKPAATNLTGNGGSGSTVGRIDIIAGAGGASFLPTTASGGPGGGIRLTSGTGGSVPFATTNATGGGGGTLTFTGGAGAVGDLATNSITGGAGGGFLMNGGAGGASSFATTQAVAGSGGSFIVTAGSSTSPSGGWSRKTGTGGSISITAGASGNSTRTNSGDAGALTFTGGKSGDVTTSPGDPGNAGNINLLAGAGGSGGTNANGGSIYVVGGTGAISGNVILGVTSAGLARGNIGVGTNNPQAKLHVAGDIAMTGAALPAYLGASPTNNVQTTNWFGRVQASAAAVIEAAFNQFSELVVTNRIAAATTITLTNSSPGYADMTISLLGEIAGGTSRTVTLVANTGQLIANLDTFGTALATSYAFTLTNGNAVEISDELRQLNGTNVHKVVTRQFAF